MRALTKALVSVTAAVGIAAGGLATAGTATAAMSPAPRSAVAASPAAVAAYNNLGLTRTQAEGIQCFLNIVPWRSGLVEDGYLGPTSWEAMQRFLNDARNENLVEDGVPGSLTIKALQRWLKGLQKYSGRIDGIAGPLTQAAFARQGTYSYNAFC